MEPKGVAKPDASQQSERMKSKTRVAEWSGVPRLCRWPKRPSNAAGYAADGKYKVSIMPIAPPTILTLAVDVGPFAWLPFRILKLALISFTRMQDQTHRDKSS